MPAEGCAICVQLSVFKPARLKLGALYTSPRYSARNERCLVNAYCTPTPYTNVGFVSKVAPAKVPPKLPVGSNTRRIGAYMEDKQDLSNRSNAELNLDVDPGTGSDTGCRGCSIKLQPRIGRESHHGIVLDPVQDELGDVPVQREASEPRLWRVRRKDFYLPLAQLPNQPV
jgi:hypothetical protein